MSTWQSVHLDVCLLWFCPFGSLSIWHSVHIGLRPQEGLSNLVWLTCYYLYLWVGPLLVLSTLDSAHVWFSLLGILFDLGVCLLGICPLESLATWHFAHFCVCPLLFLSTLDSAHIWDCLLGIMFIKDFFFSRSCKLGMLFTWVFDY